MKTKRPKSGVGFYEFSAPYSIEPGGWLRRCLVQQRQGLTGHLEVAGAPFNTRLWACPMIPYRKGASPWWPYEQTAYWIDGLTRCGLALQDQSLLRRAKRQIDYVLNHVAPDGYLGPPSCRAPMPAGRWPHVIFFRAMLAWQQATGDERIVPALVRHYLEAPHDLSQHRDVCHIEILCRLAELTGRRVLIRLAEKIWADFQSHLSEADLALAEGEVLAKRPAFGHGVTYCETSKLGAILYRVTKKEIYLRYTLAAYRKLEHFHLLVSGAPSSTEALRGTTALDAHETCDVVDFSWGAGHLLLATGDPHWADAIERATFNALPGAVTKDFKALQYFSAPNQVILSRTSCHLLAATGRAFMTYRPRPGTECCSSNVSRGFPNYVGRMWLQLGADPATALYGPSVFSFDRGGRRIRLTQETDYPFSEWIDFEVDVDAPTRFTLWLRIPGWCRGASLTCNETPLGSRLRPGEWIPVRRLFRQHDRVRLHLPMKPRLRVWPDGGVSIERGPLVYALPIPARWVRDGQDPNQTEAFPAWELFPDGPWNYALEATMDNVGQVVHFVEGRKSKDPWAESPISLTVPARRVRGWNVRRAKRLPSYGATLVDPYRNIWSQYPTVVHGDFRITPPLPDPDTLAGRLAAKTESINLVPYGCTLLRLTVFPQVPPNLDK